jgi:hypothetical protein
MGSATEAMAGVVTPEASGMTIGVAAPVPGAAIDPPAARATTAAPVSAPHTEAARLRRLTNS